MSRDLDAYAREAASLIKVIKVSFDPSASVACRRAPGIPPLGTRITGELRRNGIVLKVKEYFNYDPLTGEIDKEFRYTFLVDGEDKLRIETDPKGPPHAHFSPRYSSGSGRHYGIERWTTELQDIDFPLAFRLWSDMVRSGGMVPEPFTSAQ